MPPAKAPIRPGSWTWTASNMSVTAELGRAPFPEGCHTLRQVLAGPRPVEGGLELLARRAVQCQLVPGDRQRCQTGDFGGPCQSSIEVTDALRETEAECVLTVNNFGGEQHRSRRSFASERG